MNPQGASSMKALAPLLMGPPPAPTTSPAPPAAPQPATPQSLPKLQQIISQYHSPVPPQAQVGTLVPDLANLAAKINGAWPKLKPKYKTIDGTWTVIYLAGDIDLRNGVANP